MNTHVRGLKLQSQQKTRETKSERKHFSGFSGTKRTFLMIALSCITLSAAARVSDDDNSKQTDKKTTVIRWADGTEHVRQVSDSIYELVSAGEVSLKFVNNACMIFIGKNRDENVYRYEKSENRIEFYMNDDLLGYCIPSQKRYYRAAFYDGKVVRENVFGVVLDGNFYEASGELRFLVNEDVPLETLGVLLFILN